MSAAASIMPASVVQAEGLDAIFLCQHPTDSGTIDWTINGTALRNIDTSNGLIRSEGRGAAVEALIIAAIPKYNNTVVVCLKFIRINESVILETSPPAVLMVQGTLHYFVMLFSDNIVLCVLPWLALHHAMYNYKCMAVDVFKAIVNNL